MPRREWDGETARGEGGGRDSYGEELNSFLLREGGEIARRRLNSFLFFEEGGMDS